MSLKTAGLLTVPAFVIGTLFLGPSVAMADKDQSPEMQRVAHAVTIPADATPKSVTVPEKESKPKVAVSKVSSYAPPKPKPEPKPETTITVASPERPEPIQKEQVAPKPKAAPKAKTETPPQPEAQMRTHTPAPAPKPAPKPKPKPVDKKVEPKAPSSAPSGIAGTAVSFKGSPYVWGGESPSGWDCSGFVKYVYGQHGISVPHGTSALMSSGQFVPTSSPKPGDLVFQNGGGHVGIYIGNGKIVGAQNPSVGTVERPANSPYGPLTGYYTLAG